MNRTSCTTLLLALWLVCAHADQLLPSGSFESPRVAARTPLAKGGSPMLGGGTDWRMFVHPRRAEDGALVSGLTTELTRTGRQSLYVEFDHFRAPQQGVVLESRFVSILPGKPYRVSIWGRLPKKGPLTLDQRLPFLKLFVEFFQADRETQTGDVATGVRIQPLPGSPDRPPLFTNAKWTEFFGEFPSPADAAFIKITWKWDTPPQDGETTGSIFFDDATIQGEAGPVSADEELPMDDDEDDAPAAKPGGDKPALPAGKPLPGAKENAPPARR